VPTLDEAHRVTYQVARDDGSLAWPPPPAPDAR